jgi:N-acetylglucosaminyldiphosphoundecaprenol N-acetyl-beta-D-mannosaminyltransferase
LPTSGTQVNLPTSILLGVRVHHATMAQAVDAVAGLLRAQGAHQILTLNGAMLVRAAHDESVRAVLNRCALAVADGAGVQLTARLLGSPPLARVAGVDLTEQICGLAAAHGYRVFLLGAAPRVADAAAAALRLRYPALIIAGTAHGYFSDEEFVIEQIRRASPHILLVALGFPRQELWIAAQRDRLAVPVMMGVGGTFDVLAGRVRRAPRWMQKLGLEWVYRLVQEPQRWRVVISLVELFWLALIDRMRRRTGPGESTTGRSEVRRLP